MTRKIRTKPPRKGPAAKMNYFGHVRPKIKNRANPNADNDPWRSIRSSD